ncbi:MAG: hypothetical protein QQN55_07470 [Nitrosopumilus sp.]
MKKDQCFDILAVLKKGKEVNISTEEFQYFMYFREHQKTQIYFRCEVTGNHVEILGKGSDEKDDN